MPSLPAAPGIVPNRLTAQEIEVNFADLHPPFSQHEAAVAADRCYFCYDAPCVEACPTGIDIPLFIRQIAADSPESAAVTILDSNILGGMCARVCPTEVLCEEACVREVAEGKPVDIGRLQRYATDALMERESHPYRRAEPSGYRVAVVGAGPAGLACAHRLAMRGHKVDLMDAMPKAGGLNEYGIAAYKTVEDFAAREVEWILQIGGINLFPSRSVESADDLHRLRQDYDAVFLGFGLAGVNALNRVGRGLSGVDDAVSFIADLRQARDFADIPIGRHVVVIGGGMTAIDAAVQSRLLGAECVSLVYRRSRSSMKASEAQQDLATSKGVRIIECAVPLRFVGEERVTAVEFAYATEGPEGLVESTERFSVQADQVFLAIGQRLRELSEMPRLDAGKIRVTQEGRTSLNRVWAGGDCVTEGDDLTVTAVAQGRDAAEDIHRVLTAQSDSWPSSTGTVHPGR